MYFCSASLAFCLFTLPQAVKQYLSHLVKGRVVRYELPGIYGFNFVLTRALGGGGLGSLNVDRQGAL
jgi:hypothetical protein